MIGEGEAASEVRGLRRRLWAERFVFAIMLGGVLAFHFGKLGGLGGKRACLIAVEGRPAAVLESRAEAERLLEEIKTASGLPGAVRFSQKVALHRVPAGAHDVVGYAEAMKALASRLEPVVDASAIVVNGEVVLGLPTNREAVEVLSEVLREFSPPGEDVQATFKEKVKVETREVGAERFAPSAKEAVTRILKSTAPKGEHEVKPGETGWKIALTYGVALSRLEGANPEVNINKIRAGDRLKLPGELPPLTVVARREVTEETGPVRQRVRITYENGAEVRRDVIGRERPAAREGAGRRQREPAREEQGP